MENYPSNSKNTKPAAEPPAKKIDKIVTGEVIRRKKSLSRRFLDTFGGGDATSVWGYIVNDVLVPAAKDMVSDAVSQGIERMLFGEVRGRSSTSRRLSQPAGYTNYTRYSSPGGPPRDDRRDISSRARATHDFGEILLPTRVEAEEIISTMFEISSQYGQVTVGDLYDMIGVTGSFTDQKWGWNDLRGAQAVRARDGYLLQLPPTIPLV